MKGDENDTGCGCGEDWQKPLAEARELEELIAMKVDGKSYRTIWEVEGEPGVVEIIDQRYLPHQWVIERLSDVEAVERAIRDMHVRGAGLIGATAGYGMAIGVSQVAEDGWREQMQEHGEFLMASRPTAVNLEWAVRRQWQVMDEGGDLRQVQERVWRMARQIADEDAEWCRRIGEHGLRLIEEIYEKKQGVVNVLTHCNAGWLAFVDYGSATSPIYAAHDRGIPVHVWVDETRPRNQGAKLTAWELGKHGVAHTVIADNVGGHLMQHGMVDLVIVGSDRTTRSGDVANKIGTYLKALAAKDNGVPFYVALPSSTIDWQMRDGVREIPIELRGEEEVVMMDGWDGERVVEVRVTPEGSPAANYGFDVTPARLVSGLITERGVHAASEDGLLAAFPEWRG